MATTTYSNTAVSQRAAGDTVSSPISPPACCHRANVLSTSCCGGAGSGAKVWAMGVSVTVVVSNTRRASFRRHDRRLPHWHWRCARPQGRQRPSTYASVTHTTCLHVVAADADGHSPLQQELTEKEDVLSRMSSTASATGNSFFLRSASSVKPLPLPRGGKPRKPSRAEGCASYQLRISTSASPMAARPREPTEACCSEAASAKTAGKPFVLKSAGLSDADASMMETRTSSRMALTWPRAGPESMVGRSSEMIALADVAETKGQSARAVSKQSFVSWR